MVEEMEGINGASNLVTAAFFISGATVGSSPLRSLVLTNWKRHGCSFFIGSSTPVPHKTAKTLLIYQQKKHVFFKLATQTTVFGNYNPNWRPCFGARILYICGLAIKATIIGKKCNMYNMKKHVYSILAEREEKKEPLNPPPK